MATFDDVRRLALALPETSETQSWGHAFWRVRDKGFVWERPLRKSDLAALGDAAPQGPILGARVEHLAAKQAMIETEPELFFTIPHFEGYSAVLVLLERIGIAELEEVIIEAWLCRAPKKVRAEYLASHPELALPDDE